MIDATQQETLRLQGLIAKLLSQNEAARREREERRAYIENKKRSRDCSANGYRQQQSTYPRGFQRSQWTPHEGSQRWPYAAEQYAGSKDCDTNTEQKRNRTPAQKLKQPRQCNKSKYGYKAKQRWYFPIGGTNQRQSSLQQ